MLALALIWSVPAIAAGTTQRMQALLDAEQPTQAYELGRSQPEPTDPEFDLWFGVAAMEIGQVNEGLAALNRHLARYPDHPQNPRAQAELGRGYMILGDYPRSRQAFEAVLKTNPPPAVATNIQAFLDALDQKTAPPRPDIKGFLELGAGPDSNVNGGVADATVNLPVFGLTTLASSGVEKSATAGVASGGISVEYAPWSNLTAFAGLQGDLRLYNVNTEFNQRGATVSGGLAWAAGDNLLRGAMLYNTIEIDNEPYRELPLLSVDYFRQIDPRSVAGLSVQLGEILYDGDNELRDATLTSIGASYRRQFAVRTLPVVSLGVGFADENNQHSRPDLGRSIWSVRGNIDLTLSPRWTAGAGVTWQQSDYGDEDPLLGVERDDEFASIDLSLRYQIRQNLSASADFQYSRNTSNLELYEYDRGTMLVKLRYDFN